MGRALAEGVPAVLFRDKDLSDTEAEPLLRALREATHARGALLYVAGRPSLATAINADGLHLPEGASPPSSVDWNGPLSTAAHGESGLERAARLGARFALLGPLFPTRSHPDTEPLGPAAFADLATGSPVPLLAVGGITPETSPDALAAGAAGVACIDAILGAEDPAAAVQNFWDVLEG